MNKQVEHFLENKIVPIITIAIIFLFTMYILDGKREQDQAVIDACIKMNTDNIDDMNELIKDCIELLEAP